MTHVSYTIVSHHKTIKFLLMKYVPDLIPEQHKVKSLNFEKQATKQKHPSWWTAISTIGVIFFLFGSLVTIFSRFLVGVTFLSVALLMIPKVHSFIESSLRFKFSWIIKTILIVILLLPLSFLNKHYAEIEAEQARLDKIEQERIERNEVEKKLEAEKIENERIERLASYLTTSDKLFRKKKTTEAISLLDSALLIAKSEKDTITTIKLDYLLKSKRYSEAIDIYNTKISQQSNLGENLYLRAVCLSKQNKTQEAVNDLHRSIELGYEKSQIMYDKINPERKRVIDYITRCCDGSSSRAKGSGACSHHRGVCNWNEPVYQTYRKY